MKIELIKLYLKSVKEKKMKIQIATLLILGLITFQSCQNNSEKVETPTSNNDEVTILGTWTLYKEQINGKKIDHSEKPTAVSLTFKENGFYIFFDKITDKKISDSGVDEIQERYKGQYEKEDGKIMMNHFIEDSLITKNYIIDVLTNNELVLKDNNSKHIQYFKK